MFTQSAILCILLHQLGTAYALHTFICNKNTNTKNVNGTCKCRSIEGNRRDFLLKINNPNCFKKNWRKKFVSLRKPVQEKCVKTVYFNSSQKIFVSTNSALNQYAIFFIDIYETNNI